MKAAQNDPARFKSTVDEMVDAIEATGDDRVAWRF